VTQYFLSIVVFTIAAVGMLGPRSPESGLSVFLFCNMRHEHVAILVFSYNPSNRTTIEWLGCLL